MTEKEVIDKLTNPSNSNDLNEWCQIQGQI